MRFVRLVLPVLMLASLGACGDEAQPKKAQAAPPPPPVTVAKPLVKEIVEQDDFSGRFDAIDIVEVRARVSGYLESVAFTDGSVVKKGDLLFVIDRRPYRATLDQAEATLVSAQARLSFAESDLERAESLRKTGNISDQLLDQRRQNYLTAKAELDRAEATVREARLNYEFTEIRAPISGRIGRKLVSEGNLVNANQSLLTTIVSLDPIYFYFDVDERSFLAYCRAFEVPADGVHRCKSSSVKLALTDEKEPTRVGTLDFVDNRVDQATGTVRVRAILPNKDLFITPGLFGQVRVPGSKPYQGVLVPDEAIATDQERRLVWVVGDDGGVSARPVRPGPRIDGYRVVRQGLKGDETIVINGLQRVRPGAKVTPQMTSLPPKRTS
ncbi:efflux RND transporter periplasmic adaptor subunit [Chelatococcus sp. SYSU_G07232]|uniref:Efflux RND transporter periplasmic adaptor subunit n=1 Tax=Chelatococcus albus TaxID=3047466 RepID=A0ABT7AIU1_9HYPH|nr:efflux RND transporter periplasmic adaptor subunit [Chelatococcus sp. SYSU_G07232]MDJ1158516.1 efflux RND transporter periplasmic adaptor subunit [Chelatococcus sp. SYSU_G07232]